MNCPLCKKEMKERSMALNDSHELKGLKMTFTCHSGGCCAVVEVDVKDDSEYHEDICKIYDRVRGSE